MEQSDEHPFKLIKVTFKWQNQGINNTKEAQPFWTTVNEVIKGVGRGQASANLANQSFRYQLQALQQVT